MKSLLLQGFHDLRGSVARINQAVTWLVQRHLETYDESEYPNGFEYPQYMGMPPEITKRLTPEEVEWIQEHIEPR